MPAPGVIIVLGSPNDEQGNLHSIAIERCERAWQLHQERPAWPILLTGGFGEHFNTTALPHAAYLKRRLREHGVPESTFLPIAASRNTLEDASLARPITLAIGARHAAIITSDYHLERARFVFEREFAGSEVKIEFFATPTDETACRLDLAALRAHETAALSRLKSAAAHPT